jgi:DNA primase
VGAEDYRNNLQNSASYLDFLLDTAIRSQKDRDNPKNKVRILNAVLPYLAKIPSALERSEYVFRFAQRLNVEDQQLLAEVKRAARQKQAGLPEQRTVEAGSMKFAEKRLLQLLLGSGELQSQILPQCTAEDFRGLAAEKIFASLLEASGRGDLLTFDELNRQFGGSEEQTVLARLQMEEVPESVSSETAESFLSALRKLRLTSRKQEILAQILDATEQKDEEILNRLIEQRAQVDRELISLSRK